MKMNNTRITVSLPKHLKDALLRKVPKGEISGFVSEAVEEKIFSLEIEKPNAKNLMNKLRSLRKRAPKISAEDILKAIRKGRK